MRTSGRCRGAVLVLALSATLVAPGCATREEAPRPVEPLAVRVTEMSPEVIDAIAARVAQRIPVSPTAGATGVGVPTRYVFRQPPAGARPAAPPPLPAAAKPETTPPSAEAIAALEQNVDLALAWLAAHQESDGSWSASQFISQCRDGAPCTGTGEPAHTPGVTSLALLCFLGRGHTHEQGPYAENVKRGLLYLRTIQDSEGCFGPRANAGHFQYSHAYATFAAVEAYRRTKSPILRGSAQSGLRFILQSQNPYLGWRYGVRDGDNDTSVTSLMTVVLAAGRDAGLEIDAGAFRGALAWVDKMTEPEFGRTGYQNRGGPPARPNEMLHRFPADRVETVTAAALSARLAAGQSPHEEAIRKGADLLARKPPVWDPAAGTIDFVYWYWGTRALARSGGEPWRAWLAAVVPAVGQHQRREDGGHAKGSWDPIDPWSPDGGRVYSTAMACLTCELVLSTAR